MVVFLLRIILLALSTLFNIFSRLIFTTIAYLLVLIIHVFKVPGEALQSALEQAANVIKACLEYFLELAVEAISILISAFFDNLKEGISGSAVATGSAIQGTLEQVANVIRACLEYFLGLVVEALSTLISAFFDNLKEGISGSAVATGSAIGELVEKTRTSLGGLLEDFPEVLESLKEMVSNVVANLWKNYMDAVGYVLENV